MTVNRQRVNPHHSDTQTDLLDLFSKTLIVLIVTEVTNCI